MIYRCWCVSSNVFLIYIIQDKIGEGSFAVVKRAVWTQGDGRKVPVAVKLLRETANGYADELQREINNMQRLKHPNLIRLYGIVLTQPVSMVCFLCFYF